MSAAEHLLELLRSTGWHGLMIFLRVGSAMALLPGFGEHSVPVRLRLVLAFAFTAITAPAIDRTPFQGAGPGIWLSEMLIGLMLGLSLRLTVMVLQMAGTMIAQSVSLSQVFASAGSEPVTVIGELLVLGGLALAVTLGLHVAIAGCLIGSYQDFPPGSLPDPGGALTWATDRVAAAFRYAFALSMPFIAGALIYNLALGVINKAMPQLMVAMVGAPALTLGGLIVLTFVAPVILSSWIRHLGDILARPF